MLHSLVKRHSFQEFFIYHDATSINKFNILAW